MAGISVFAGMLVGDHEYIGGEEYESKIEQYKSPGLFDGVDREKFDRKRAIELGMVGDLVKNMCNKQAPPEEFVRIALYSHLLVDAIRYDVDFTKAGEDLNILELKDKYRKCTKEEKRDV